MEINIKLNDVEIKANKKVLAQIFGLVNASPQKEQTDVLDGVPSTATEVVQTPQTTQSVKEPIKEVKEVPNQKDLCWADRYEIKKAQEQSKEYTPIEVKQLALKQADIYGNDAVKGILQSMQVACMADLKPEQYVEFMVRLERLGKGV